VHPSHGQASAAPDLTEEAAQPVSGIQPEQKTSIKKNAAETYELPTDVVEVHQDPEIKNQVIVQYLDKSKNVILQVPSSQELGVEHGIAEDFQSAAKLRAIASTAGASEGEKPNGD